MGMPGPASAAKCGVTDSTMFQPEPTERRRFTRCLVFSARASANFARSRSFDARGSSARTLALFGGSKSRAYCPPTHLNANYWIKDLSIAEVCCSMQTAPLPAVHRAGTLHGIGQFQSSIREEWITESKRLSARRRLSLKPSIN